MSGIVLGAESFSLVLRWDMYTKEFHAAFASFMEHLIPF
jgi:hypothetical protein